jgi:hypothetical protein
LLHERILAHDLPTDPQRMLLEQVPAIDSFRRHFGRVRGG